MNSNHAVWDEPKGCTTPRGWCEIEGLSVTYDGQKPCGFYLVYPSERYPVFAAAYVFKNMHPGYGIAHQQTKKFLKIHRAKQWVERTARSFPR